MLLWPLAVRVNETCIWKNSQIAEFYLFLDLCSRPEELLHATVDTVIDTEACHRKHADLR